MKEGGTVEVESYSGYRVNERPVAVTVEGRRLEVRRVLERRRTPDGDEFKIETEDAGVWVVAWDPCQDRWTLRS